MELKEQINKYETTQYIVKDGDFEVDVTEVLGTEEEVLVFLYEEGLNIAIFRMFDNRGFCSWGGYIRRFDGKNANIDYEDELNLIAGYIIEQHNEERI